MNEKLKKIHKEIVEHYKNFYQIQHLIGYKRKGAFEMWYTEQNNLFIRKRAIIFKILQTSKVFKEANFGW